MSLKSRTDYKLDLMAYGQTYKMKLLSGEIISVISFYRFDHRPSDQAYSQS